MNNDEQVKRDIELLTLTPKIYDASVQKILDSLYLESAHRMIPRFFGDSYAVRLSWPIYQRLMRERTDPHAFVPHEPCPHFPGLEAMGEPMGRYKNIYLFAADEPNGIVFAGKETAIALQIAAQFYAKPIRPINKHFPHLDPLMP